MQTVHPTRAASEDELLQLMLPRLDRQLKIGVTTCEIKSGYGLTVADELKMLRTINKANSSHPIEIIPTCLAAHVKPPEFATSEEYLETLLEKLLPKVMDAKLSNL